MTIDIITLFPGMFTGPFDESIIQRAQDKSLVNINTHNLRDWAIDKRGTVDDKPYGGGTGMLLRPEPIFQAVEKVRQKTKDKRQKTILLDAGGKKHNQQLASEYSKIDHIILVCGHYEGVDYRVHEHLADDVVSIGDYVLTGGELPAMVIVDSIVRLIPGVLEKEDATQIESFSSESMDQWVNGSMLEYPQYTRPEELNGHRVPEVLLSGNHAEIQKWREEQATARTREKRPDLTGKI